MSDNDTYRRASRRRLLGLAGLAGATPLLGTSTAGPAYAQPSPIAPSGAWSWFGDPRALHYEGEHNRTYVGYITNNPDGTGDIMVAQYDHDTSELTRQVVMAGFQRDDHNNPAICVRPDRRIVLFWTGHGLGGVPIHYRRSAIPEDINGGWEPIRRITTNTPGNFGWTYTNLAQLTAEPSKLHVFWRGGDFNPAFSTTAGADIWTPARTFITYPGERPYVKVWSDGVDTIHFAFTQGHPRNVPSSIFYMYYRAGGLYRASGRRIGSWGTAVRPGQADKVYNADTGPNPGPKAWIWDVAADAQGRPALVYANFPTDADHRYRYARWTGTSWIDHEITAAGGTISEDTREPNYSGGVALDHTDPSIVLLSRQQPGGRHEVERWTTGDDGRTWTSEAITQNSGELNVRPVKPSGLRGNGAMSAIWLTGEYPSYANYQTRVMALGPNGSRIQL